MRKPRNYVKHFSHLQIKKRGRENQGETLYERWECIQSTSAVHNKWIECVSTNMRECMLQLAHDLKGNSGV